MGVTVETCKSSGLRPGSGSFTIEKMKIDCHVHVSAVAAAQHGYASKRMRRSLAFLYLIRKLGLHRIDEPFARDAAYVDHIAELVAGSELDRAVLLALDQVYDPSGQALENRTHLYVANDYVRDQVARYPEVFFYGASVHPYRADAAEELHRVAEQGAVLVKLLPNSQGFDPADPRLEGYYRTCADLGMPLLMHAGFEHTLPPIDQRFGDPLRLERALGAGVTTIVAHCGGAGLMHRRETFAGFVSLAKRYTNLWGDTAAMSNFWRVKYLWYLLDPQLCERKIGDRLEEPLKRLLHGSDFPIPITAWSFRGKIGKGDLVEALKHKKNTLQLDIELKRRAGLGDDILTRAAKTLRLPPGR